ncbi:MAG: serine hydrolase domain-containing protein [Acidobacteriota bacterium]
MSLESYFTASGPGAILALQRQGEEPVVSCRGLADIASGRAIGPETPFDLASCTKMFTAVAVLGLAERSHLRLEDSLSRYVELGPVDGGREITLQDLLWHTSGLPDYVLAPDLAPAIQATSLTPEQVVEWLVDQPAAGPPGVGHEYSNTNYFLLARIIESVTGSTYADYLDQSVFQPFGLRDSLVVQGTRPPQCARGYASVGVGAERSEMSELDLSVVGDGGVFSSQPDLSRWFELLFRGEIIDPASLRIALSRGRLDDGTRFDYGCGFLLETLPDGGTWCGHTGGWHGTTTICGRFLDRGLTVMVLSNDQSAPVVRIAQRAVETVDASADPRGESVRPAS